MNTPWTLEDEARMEEIVRRFREEPLRDTQGKFSPPPFRKED